MTRPPLPPPMYARQTDPGLFLDAAWYGGRRRYVAVDALLSDEAVAVANAPYLSPDADMRDAIQRAIETVYSSRSKP